ncbi:glycosyltransferase [Roseomonas sp. CCTCC AB2023176]|uniref:glycosyltransferase n=1 Tax=Roseomonas sp. CCTCC AB2023176 TaxID=3342640 RepID=UPI0035DED30C
MDETNPRLGCGAPDVSDGSAKPPGASPAPALAPPLVLMLSSAHPPADVRIVAKEGAALAAAGWEVIHLCPEPEDGGRAPDSVQGVKIRTFPRAYGWVARYRGIKALAKRAEALLPDVVHAHEPDSWLAAIRVARRTGAYAVLDVHEHYPSRLDHRVWRPFRGLARWAIRRMCRRVAQRADAVIVAKDGLADAFPRVSDIVPVRNYAAPVPVEPRQHRAGPVTLVHLGALGHSRGAMEMLRTLRLLPTDTRLLLIGRFTDGSEEEFRKATVTFGVADRIEGHAWMPHDEAVRMAAGRADIGLVLFQPGIENHRLALPHKLFDCMVAGIPVIVPAFAEEVAEVVREAGCGVLVDTTDPKAIAAAVKALSDPALRQELGENGRRAALGRFSWNTEAERLVRLYRELVPLPGGVGQPAQKGPAARPAGQSGPSPAAPAVTLAPVGSEPAVFPAVTVAPATEPVAVARPAAAAPPSPPVAAPGPEAVALARSGGEAAAARATDPEILRPAAVLPAPEPPPPGAAEPGAVPATLPDASGRVAEKQVRTAADPAGVGAPDVITRPLPVAAAAPPPPAGAVQRSAAPGATAPGGVRRRRRPACRPNRHRRCRPPFRPRRGTCPPSSPRWRRRCRRGGWCGTRTARARPWHVAAPRPGDGSGGTGRPAPPIRRRSDSAGRCGRRFAARDLCAGGPFARVRFARVRCARVLFGCGPPAREPLAR